MNYQNWKEDKVAVTSLFLDSRNPRLPAKPTSLSQQQLIEELVLHDDVYSLAKDIVTMGYFPDERLIVVDEDGKRKVVEGNRRLAALKLLINPDLAPAIKVSRFKELSKRAQAAEMQKVRIIIAPSREAAYVLLLNKHTQTAIAKWSLIQQARFFKTILDDGMSAVEISKRYSVSVGGISDFMQMLEMYEVACTLELPEKINESVMDSRNFPASTLQRIYQRTATQKFLGIEFNAAKQLVGKIDKEEFKKGYARIVSDIVGGNVDSRIAGDNKKIDLYLGEISGSKPDHKKHGKFTAGDLLSNQAALPSKPVVAAPVKKHHAVSPALIPRNFKCTLDSSRIEDVFWELRKLKINDYPNAVSVLLRTLLEMSLLHYMQRTGALDNLLIKAREKVAKKNQALPKDWSPSLHQMMGHITNDNSSLQMEPLARKAINTLLSTGVSIYSADFLNAFVHNKFVIPTEAQLRGFWEQLEPIFRLTLAEPELVKK